MVILHDLNRQTDFLIIMRMKEIFHGIGSLVYTLWGFSIQCFIISLCFKQNVQYPTVTERLKWVYTRKSLTLHISCVFCVTFHPQYWGKWKGFSLCVNALKGFAKKMNFKFHNFGLSFLKEYKIYPICLRI